MRNEDTASLHACILDNTLLSEAGKKCNIRLLKRDKNVVCEFVSSQQAYQMSALCGFFANICEKILKIASFVRRNYNMTEKYRYIFHGIFFMRLTHKHYHCLNNFQQEDSILSSHLS